MKALALKGIARSRPFGVAELVAGWLGKAVALVQRNVHISIVHNTLFHAMEIRGSLFNVVCLIGLLSCPFSCIPRSKSEVKDTIQLAPLAVTEEVLDIEPYISELSVIRVGSDSIARVGITKILFADPIVFLSGGVVFSASDDWKNISRIGNVGRGPGEYLSIKDIAVNTTEDEVWCMDVLNDVIRYDLKTGSYLGRMKFEESGYARAMIPQEENSILFYTPNPLHDFPRKGETFFCLNQYDSHGKKMDRLLPWTQFNVMAGFSNPVSAMGDGKYILTPESSNVSYVFGRTGLSYQLFFDFGNKWIPRNLFDPKEGDPSSRVGDLFDMDCYKMISSVYIQDNSIYFHVFGRNSSNWNFFLSKDGSRGIRWKSVGILTPPIKAIATDRDYLYFPYDDYGHVEQEQDPLKTYVIKQFGLPKEKGYSYLVKVKFNVD